MFWMLIVKLQYICSNFRTLYFKDTFSCIVKLHYVLIINFHYIYCKITIEIFNSVLCTLIPPVFAFALYKRGLQCTT